MFHRFARRNIADYTPKYSHRASFRFYNLCGYLIQSNGVKRNGKFVVRTVSTATYRRKKGYFIAICQCADSRVRGMDGYHQDPSVTAYTANCGTQ